MHQNLKKNVEVILANPRGFCAGVSRAIEIVKLAVKYHSDNRKVYVLHEIVHNKYIINSLKEMGVIFIDTLDQAEDGSILIYSAHGISKEIEHLGQSCNLEIIDATCPLVNKVHKEVQAYDKKGYQIILIGHKGHREVEGTMGQITNPVLLVQNLSDIDNIEVTNSDKLAYVTQTTLSVDDTKEIINKLKQKFPNIKGPDLKDICYATQNRQTAVKQLSELVDIIFVLGSKNSSNSNRLKELAELKTPAFLIDSYQEINLDILKDVNKIGITAGASAPEILITEVIDLLKQHMNIKLSDLEVIRENVAFNIPKQLREYKL
ncbi:4-hydroxy-3-methylbut-2-enyl diphosphate reductase [Ehrlichia chaffeensis str. Heartland]|uniref:4-hydroxy-3-methylbut-2-enyl diphosphate reductase n=1 Tax=Ehrlichia chaffeensis (strain ATCC CRL-10679 / Arkansas) TaxID=205920 RepID=Q2GGW6_EHRCR|nr:4-hydroxy-3-methylbut-2-enyl diphosphate reductase [Ehrlichia chaffeensis]ABD45537.1 hydroxymethylbutenyl pyrophosphate reductase [Ehrlichia chaffeensis str. Arkansas]AHX03598.1 4-hydroxy-3-methylbut-2-enyl diphosphate reductase [Ehrlichia chaffeensis str. Heartland]AHX05680.1 4-hydroxy-3-methylbut-2-enyl diphosphate reductase [Ehrlichia chaffeensis str. Jax]AHX06671.1 4-hydroxy-3-methylbut-2-enyl diphosphate reductase [Ehrlichia chaffeensis str. Liberty]AHX08405.1 4-hydroxy-3-methylbut-2-e